MKNALILVSLGLLISNAVFADVIPYTETSIGKCASAIPGLCESYHKSHATPPPPGTFSYDTATSAFSAGGMVLQFSNNQVKNAQYCIALPQGNAKPLSFCQNAANHYVLQTMSAEYSPATQVITNNMTSVANKPGYQPISAQVSDIVFSPTPTKSN